jgi:hypothetical protein
VPPSCPNSPTHQIHNHQGLTLFQIAPMQCNNATPHADHQTEIPVTWKGTRRHSLYVQYSTDVSSHLMKSLILFSTLVNRSELGTRRSSRRKAAPNTLTPSRVVKTYHDALCTQGTDCATLATVPGSWTSRCSRTIRSSICCVRRE